MDTCSTKSIAQLPKDEKDIKTSTNMLVVIEDNAKVAVDFALVSSHGMQQATGE